MRTRLALIVFVSLPLLIVAVLTALIAGSLADQGRTTRAGDASAQGEAEPMSYVAPRQPEAAEASDEGLVQPETLEQGFILVVEDPSKLGSASQPITIGTNHGNWNPADPDWAMTPRSDGRWQIIVPKPDQPGRMQFKFARGSWETVELANNSQQIDNRILPKIDPAEYADGSRPIFEFVVPKWADQIPGATVRPGVEDPSTPLEVTGRAFRLQVPGGAGRAAGIVRDAIVWVPPGYDDSDASYPVLYLMDGQNVFMQQPGTPGEWGADETATELIRSGEIEPMVIVGVPHSGLARADEYLPAELIDGVEPSADEFIAWMELTVMPRVERAFRVKTGAASTAIGGASFGGIISLHAASSRSDLFGKAIVESPSVLSDNQRMLGAFTAESFAWPKTVFLGMGDQEAGTSDEAQALNARYVAAARDLDRAASLARSNVETVVGTNHVHNETAWADRFPMALKHLYGTD
ncbi:MAG: alpha/beta hydrolase-fold protein [Planctomycetota bacterium]